VSGNGEHQLPYRVRPMQVDDVEQVVSIESRSFSSPWPASAYRRDLLSGGVAHYLVCVTREDDRKVLGYGGYWAIDDELHVSTLAVDPDYRRRGVGEFILASMLAEGLERGARMATLEVRVSNHAAQNLYRKYGFRVAGRRRRYYRDNSEDALIMTTEPFESPAYRSLFIERWQALIRTLAGEAEHGSLPSH